MNSTSQNLIEMWREARTRFTGLLSSLKKDDLQKKLWPSPNSAGFLVRHIADVELLFAKNVFGLTDLKVTAKTVIDKRDTGEWTNLPELIAYEQLSYKSLSSVLEEQSESDWEKQISTKEFGTKTKAEALGRIVSHTAYHAGQLALLLKYGKG